MALINSVKLKFGNNISACFFHLRQCVYRHLQTEGLQIQYNNPNYCSIKQAAQAMCALAFVPVEDVKSC